MEVVSSILGTQELPDVAKTVIYEDRGLKPNTHRFSLKQLKLYQVGERQRVKGREDS